MGTGGRGWGSKPDLYFLGHTFFFFLSVFLEESKVRFDLDFRFLLTRTLIRPRTRRVCAVCRGLIRPGFLGYSQSCSLIRTKSLRQSRTDLLEDLLSLSFFLGQPTCRERERQRQRQRERQRDRERQSETETERQTQRETETERERERQRDR